MASLAQYSHALHDAPASRSRAACRGVAWAGMAIYAGIGVLVAVAAFVSA